MNKITYNSLHCQRAIEWYLLYWQKRNFSKTFCCKHCVCLIAM